MSNKMITHIIDVKQNNSTCFVLKLVDASDLLLFCIGRICQCICNPVINSGQASSVWVANPGYLNETQHRASKVNKILEHMNN